MWVNFEPWDLCSVMAKTVSTACMRLGSIHWIWPLPSLAEVSRLERVRHLFHRPLEVWLALDRLRRAVPA